MCLGLGGFVGGLAVGKSFSYLIWGPPTTTQRQRQRPLSFPRVHSGKHTAAAQTHFLKGVWPAISQFCVHFIHAQGRRCSWGVGVFGCAAGILCVRIAGSVASPGSWPPKIQWLMCVGGAVEVGVLRMGWSLAKGGLLALPSHFPLPKSSVTSANFDKVY